MLSARDIDPEYYQNLDELYLWLFVLVVMVVIGVRFYRKGWMSACIVGVIVLISGAVMIPDIPRARGESQRAMCINNLKLIDDAKLRWANDHHKMQTDCPTDSDLFGEGRYLNEKPTCPAGGIYYLGKVNEKPKCSFGKRGHDIDSQD